MESKMEHNAIICQNYHSDSSESYKTVNRKRTLAPHSCSNQFDDVKRPRLTVDTTTEPLCEALSSNESFISAINENDTTVNHNSDTINTTTSGLSAYLEDIVSDEELDEIIATPPTDDRPRGKDELLLLMDQVDFDITSIEQRIITLENKQKELIETVRKPSEELSHVTMATPEESVSGQQKSLMELIYCDNRIKACNSSNVTTECSFTAPLYYQLTEAPQYWYNMQSHKRFRPELLKYLKARKLDQYKKECSLCVVYDELMEEWKKKVEKWEKSQKKRVKEIRNKDIFEKTFPELRSKSEQLRDQAERFSCSRSGVRSFGFVKSEAELNELAYELFEQEEAKGRHSLTHANIPSMILDDKERRVRFTNTNGLLKDPMILYRGAKNMLLWNDNEKVIFREKFQLFPKNFEKISTYLPNKSVSDCVRYYYLAKKNSNFKSLSRRFRRRRHHQIPKSHEYSSSLLIDQSKPKPHPQTDTATMSSSPTHKDATEWTKDEICRLKNGLRVYGRVWGKVYREVGGDKTATQCKQFYDDYSTDEILNLNEALADHSAIKNAERVEKKMAEMKKVPIVESIADEESDPETSDHMSSQEEDLCSDSETTITDSGQEEEEEVHKPKLNPLNLGSSGPMEEESLQSPLDIFLSAAEALSNTVPSEVALHDHTYSCPPLDIQGGSGLQLIAAAAAVVSPSLSRTTWTSTSNNKVTPLSHNVKAPRGRPPSTQKRNAGNPQKISPSFLTPTSGVSLNVPLQDVKPTLRGRSRSAPTEKPRSCIPQKNPALPSPLVLKGATKLFTTVQQPMRAGQSPLSYSRTKDGGTVVSLKSSSHSLDKLVNVATIGSTHDLQKQQFTTTPILQSKNVSNRSRENTNSNNNPVLELNLGSMALLLAAGGNNQQATLLLPQSSLFNNKHTLALLHSNNRSETDTSSSFTVTKQSPTISIDLSKTTMDNSSIPIVTPMRSQSNKQTFTLSLSKPPTITLPVTSKVCSSAPATPVATPTTPVTPPTTDDLSNLNLLSNLVVGLSSTKPQSLSKSSTITTSSTPSTNSWKKHPNESTRTKPVSSYSNSTQQSVMLYTRSLPLNSEAPQEEEDHLEYATRGIDELTRLLGGANNPNNTNNGLADGKQQPLVWSPDDLLCNPFTCDEGTKCINNTSPLITVNSTNSFVTGRTPANNILTELASHSTN